jgi:hypothetical protein
MGVTDEQERQKTMLAVLPGLRVTALSLQRDLRRGKLMSTQHETKQGSAKFVDRLAKVCGLLGSDHDGERASAAFQATKLLRSAGITWREFVEAAAWKAMSQEQVRAKPVKPPPKRKPSPPPPTKPDWRVMVGICTRWGDRLEEWERRYVSHLKASGRQPTKKILRGLEEIYDRAMASQP